MLGDEYTLLDLKAIGCTEDIPENEPTLAGNALATHDIEAAFFGTGLGQDIYTQALQPLPQSTKSSSLEDIMIPLSCPHHKAPATQF